MRSSAIGETRIMATTMTDMTATVPTRKRPGLFLACVLLVLAALFVFRGAFNLYLERSIGESRDDMSVALTSTVLDIAERFNRVRWMRQRAEPLLRAAQRRTWNARTATAAGKALHRLFPAADVFAFDAAGRLAWQSGNEPSRTREMLWAELSALAASDASQADTSGAARSDRAQRICRSLYGAFTAPADLAGIDGLPQYFLDRYRLRLSWVVPAETGPAAGLWLIVDPQRLPSRIIARDSIFRLAFRPDQALVLRKTPAGLRKEAQTGDLQPPEQVLSRLLWNQTEIETPDGLWMARYIPHENGRYALVGLSRERLDGRLAAWADRIRAAVLLAALALIGLGWRVWMRNEPLALSLRAQVVILFLITAVLPVVMLCGFGLERSSETARLERSRWESLLRGTLTAVDTSYREFREQRRREGETFERALVETIAAKGSVEAGLASFSAGLRRYDLFVITADGAETRRGSGIPSIHKGGDYPVMLRLLLARMLEVQGKPVPAALVRTQPLIQGEDLERALTNAARTNGAFNRIRIGKRNMVSRYAYLRDAAGEMRGLIGYAFDETEFAREFVDRIIARSTAGEYGAVRIAALGNDGRLHPSGMKRDADIIDLFHRVQSFRAHETAVCTMDGGQALVTGFFPEQLGGYLLMGWIDAALLGEGRRTILQFLALMLAWSLIWMVGCAMFLSRRLVDQVGALTVFVGEIARGDYDARTPVTSDDELGRLAVTFNEMAEKLGHRERMRHLVSDQVWDEVRRDDTTGIELGGERREVAILFSHLHGFDRLLESGTPEAVIDLLNGYFSRLDPEIRRHGGSIDKLIGDAIMAVFFAAADAPHPAQRAVDAAVAMMEAQDALNAERVAAGQRPLRTDIGIHFGPAISGKVGSREGRIDYTVIGDSVSTAARLCTAAASRPTASIIISTAVAEHLPDCHALEALEPIALKGKAEPLRLFAVR